MHIAIVVSEFNRDISERLLAGALHAFKEEGINSLAYVIERVPGAFEIPLRAVQLIDTKNFDAIIALGCVIEGETDHYRAVCDGVTYGLQKVAIETRTPIMCGVLMCKKREQALYRSGNNVRNKGYECVKAVVKML